jgi:uncharacterized membrane protein YfcA
VGAGALGITVIRQLMGDRDPRRLVATDIVHAIPIAFLGGASYSLAGLLDWVILGLLLLGSIPGAILGSLVAQTIDALCLKKILGAVLVIAAIALLLNLAGLTL